jgi:mannose-6-phosphate isomerase-like protein (cupin superfamily)
VRSAFNNRRVHERQDQPGRQVRAARPDISTRVVGFVNDYKLQVVKAVGPFVRLKHDETDDFFLVVTGHLTTHLRDRDIELDQAELFVLPRGVEHCPDAAEQTEVLLIEPNGTPNTGDAGGSMTAEPRML